MSKSSPGGRIFLLRPTASGAVRACCRSLRIGSHAAGAPSRGLDARDSEVFGHHLCDGKIDAEIRPCHRVPKVSNSYVINCIACSANASGCERLDSCKWKRHHNSAETPNREHQYPSGTAHIGRLRTKFRHFGKTTHSCTSFHNANSRSRCSATIRRLAEHRPHSCDRRPSNQQTLDRVSREALPHFA